MTPEQRIAAIRSDLTERNMEYPLGARDAWWLLRYAEALCAVAEAAEGMVAITTVAISRDGYGHFCPWCDAFEVYDELTHDPTCPWLQLQSALQRWKGVEG